MQPFVVNQSAKQMIHPQDPAPITDEPSDDDDEISLPEMPQPASKSIKKKKRKAISQSHFDRKRRNQARSTG
jgi:hypothetical protein